jgi:hypothetical protein
MATDTPVNTLMSNTNIGFAPTVSSFTILFWIIGLLALCVGVAVAFKYYRLHESPWWSDRARSNNALWDWLGAFRSSPSFGQYGTLNEVPSGLQLSAPIPTIQAAVKHMESPPPPQVAWCFVGEDLTGRYCVKVPSAESCDSTRVFNSQQDCEMKSGNALPSGVVSPHDGRKMTPLSSGLLTP